MHQLAGKQDRRVDARSSPDPSKCHHAPTWLELDLGRDVRAEFNVAYIRQLGWLSEKIDLHQAAAGLLAARIAASLIIRKYQHLKSASTSLQRLLAPQPTRSGLQSICVELGLLDGTIWLSDADLTRLMNAWPLCLELGELLASGGDDRLEINPVTGVNRYGCSPRPRTDMVSFGSCTASSLTAGAFAAAEEGRRAMVMEALQGTYASATQSVCSCIEGRILAAFNCTDLADAVLTASGTDAALIVTGLISSEEPQSHLTSILVSPSETGSGVPLAVQGCHFATTAPSGELVNKGAPLSGITRCPQLVTIELRDPAGQPFSDEEIAQACDNAIRSALPNGRVVLHAIDGSKTGLTAPARHSLRDFARRYGSRLDIVIDACQARVEPARIRGYLEDGFPILVTGSKFFSAPGFCGAVLFPRDRLSRIRSKGQLAAGLAAYANIDGGLKSRQCPGLLLRWIAALHEMDRFATLPNDEVRQRLGKLGTTILAALRRDDRLGVVEAPRPEGSNWSSMRSVFTFTVRDERGLLASEPLRGLYRALQEDLTDTPLSHIDPVMAAARYQIGQPVQLGQLSLGGLRIAISASQIADNEDQSRHLNIAVAKLRLLLESGAQSVAADVPKIGIDA
jgi:hypothetical protein